ncbi:group II intron maturase-specific domain-containing protein [Parashewanella spongiae]|uniref:group II intron maturase-specific domain-containing protein n=2 Tax=Parashewanella spongiae TaxID=342950 RepID=UPI002436ECF7|nr:group II intron maturase-specific domain-containing protein [Parashewanella spongiae]
MRNLRQLIKKHATMSVNDLIKLLNPKLRGWANYYRHCVAKKVFDYVGHQLFQALWRWAVRKHITKGRQWVARKYFLDRNGYWRFHGRQKIADMDCAFNLVEIAKTLIERHVKIRGAATLYNPEHTAYLQERKLNKQSRNSWF